MLPNSLRGSYTIYKEDTDSVATWLASTAKQCGYALDCLTRPGDDLSSQKGPRLKGKARKLAKAATSAKSKSSESTAHSGSTTYTIAVKDFIPLAEYIVAFQRPPVRIPSSFVRVLDRAIALRRKHNSWFSNAEKCSKDDGHNFFLGVLERVRETLKSRMPSDTVDDRMTRRPVGSTTKSSDKGHIDNAFAALSLEEPGDEFLDAPPPEKVTGIPVKLDDNSRYEAERLQQAEEQYLAAHCLLADVNAIRACIKSLWIMYRNGQIDLQSASITTNTAVELVRHIQEDYDKNFPNHADYEGLIETLYVARCISEGQDPDHRQRPDDIINMAMYDLADQVLLTTYTILASLSDVVTPGHIPLYKPGHFGFRNLSTEWSQKTPHDKLQDDKLVLLEAFSGFSAIANVGCFAEDELIRGVRQMAPGKKIPLWLTFAFQNFLDIQHVMGSEASRAVVELQTAAEDIETSLKQNSEFHKNLHTKTWDAHNDRALDSIQNVIDTWIKQDNVKKIIERSLLRNPTIAAQISGEPFELLRQYPSLCGIWLFSLRYLMQGAGMTLCNSWSSVIYAAHLYNAVRQEKLVKGIWKDMELALLFQGTDKIFIGDRPKKPEDYLKRLKLCIGVSVTSLARNARKTTPKASQKGARGFENISTLSRLFAPRYAHNGRSLSTDLDAVEEHVKSQFITASTQRRCIHSQMLNSRPSKQITSKFTTKSRLRAGTFLEGVANSLQSEGMHLTFDYFRLHRFCWMLLRNVRDACADFIRQTFGPGHLEREDQLPFVVIYLFKRAFAKDKAGKSGGTEARSKIFLEAAGAIQNMIETGGGGICVKMMEECYGYDVDWDDFDCHV
ncbi:uncharacterized protein M437DRAFT_59780 [Aureobasidium melanogenum CBS 110374]|uniref:DUF6604 domain-containing protein n=1 Tax=Aureobasidium melanogenum (strain CBS 110374) TaxID=1043003 RepID=A0A074VC89_AURM1|nr:uncharacterized protein M437DRAFT_59780 [Aureobasidium melanogenum CBS 110374]KEQ58310.1 hypothetical protein M437DRAFT_59780 [Aureobasidium melanogenum CBS 110374]